MFPVLLHPDLYRRLRQSDLGLRARFRKTLLRLRDGLWGGGTRVKRLRGISRPVYEARTDSGDRLLFTMVRAALAGEPERLVSHLQVWDLVEHDDVERTARRNRAPEAEFLELEALEEFEIDGPPPHPDAGISEIPLMEGSADEPLLGFLLPPDGFEPTPVEGISGGVRWFQLDPSSLAGEEEFQHLLDSGGEELELKLTREQYEILEAPGPLLLAGSAGSGKTTLSAHRLTAAVCSPAPLSALYLSYSPALVEHAKRLVRDLTLARGGDPGHNPPDFFTFGDLYRSLVPKDFREHQARPMTEPMFREWFRKSGRSLDPALVWEELRGILKGSCLSLSQPMLDEAAYFELGRKRAPLFVSERPEIYRIAQRYQAWLAEEGRSDRIDLCRRAMAELPPQPPPLGRGGLRRGPGPDRAGGVLRPLAVLPAGPLGHPLDRRHAADRQPERLPLGRGEAPGGQGVTDEDRALGAPAAQEPAERPARGGARQRPPVPAAGGVREDRGGRA